MFAPFKWNLWFLYLWVRKKLSKPLFPFDRNSRNLRISGVTSLPEAWFRECPRQLDNDENAVDSMSFHGVSNDGDALSVQIARRHGRSAEVHIYLRLASGEEYQLPLQPHTTVCNTDVGKNFTAAGLTFEVLEPLRRWRIRFNGLLRKGIANKWNEPNTIETLIVKFNFIWHPMYNYIAFPHDLEPRMMAEVLSSDPSRSFFHATTYIMQEEWHEQFGQISGTVDIEGREQFEFMVRGLKDRRHGVLDWRKVRKDASIIGVLENGKAFHLFTSDVEDGVKNFVYGYVVPPHNMTIYHVTKWQQRLEEFELQDKFKLLFATGGTNLVLEMSSIGDRFKLFKGLNWNFEVNVGRYSVNLNGVNGFAIASRGSQYSGGSPVPIQKSIHLLEETRFESCRRCVIDFDDLECQSSLVVGGKGASLALMNSVVKDAMFLDVKFSIPGAVCLTKTAYEIHLQSNMLIKRTISTVEDIAWRRSPGTLAEECKRLVHSFRSTKMLPLLKDEIWCALVSNFGEDFEVRKKFAVRSSALGEDGEEMSAAGQNETFLGVKGFQNICIAIVKCWASQFAFRSVEYRRQNGQLIASGMGVVVQEMVTADVAGVLFSRHPLSGSPAHMIIASNYGLGESVVSASVDPDTVILKRSWNDRLEIQERQTGTKKIQIKMSDDDDGVATLENPIEKTSEFSLSDSLALRLGEIAIFFEQCFGNSRDIEWAVVTNEISILQSRPVTTDSLMTDFEVIHEFDTATRTDNERHTTGNIGEVYPGAESPLTITCQCRANNAGAFADFSWKTDIHRFDPTVLDGPSFFYGHYFFDLIQQKSLSYEKVKSPMTKATEIAFFGRVLDNDDTAELANERYGRAPMKVHLQLAKYALRGILFSKYMLNRMAKKTRNFVVPVVNLKTLAEVYYRIERNLYADFNPVCDTHICMTFTSSLWNLVVLNMLVGSDGEYTLEKYNDFATLIGGGNGAESGEVPIALQELTKAILDEIAPKVFSSMHAKDATFWCMHTSSKVSRLFCQFLQRHGHRGLKELEFSSITWGMEPERLVHVLQGLVKNAHAFTKRNELKEKKKSIADIATHLSRWKRWILSIVLYKAKQGVCDREQSKSMMVKTVDGYRHAYRHLAKMMVQDGRIPDPELIFFFTHEEIRVMIELRSASLIRRAKQRQKLYPYMDSLIFDEMMNGFPKPISSKTEYTGTNDVIKGYPVCLGEVTGLARVVTFDDIHTIEAGDILITQATDIGWSPYFPILKGVITEIGGLISHGAVVAREFGLPCIVGAKGATRFFKSGDRIFLNAKEGFVCKVVKKTTNGNSDAKQ